MVLFGCMLNEESRPHVEACSLFSVQGQPAKGLRWQCERHATDSKAHLQSQYFLYSVPRYYLSVYVFINV